MWDKRLQNFARTIHEITKNWNISDYIQSRKNRDWDAFDKLGEEGRLQQRYQEFKKHNKSPIKEIDEDDSYGDDNDEDSFYKEDY